MKYAILDIEIKCGEYEFSQDVLTKGTGDLYKKGEKIASEMYDKDDDDDGEEYDEDGYSFNMGELYVSLKGCTEIPKDDYKVLSKYLVTL